MTWLLFVEQCLNGLQFGLMLFLLAAGLTLVFGIMDLINLAHGSLYMLGAYLVATLTQATGSFLLAVPLGIAATAVLGMVLELLVLRGLYKRDHLSQVLATFALILIANETTRAIWGVQPLSLNVPEALSGSVQLLPGLHYSAFRLLIIVVGVAVALLLYTVVTRTRIGMLIRAGASNREMATAMGTNIRWLFTGVRLRRGALRACRSDARSLVRRAGGHGREHPDSRLRHRGDRWHRLGPWRLHRCAAGRRGGHLRSRLHTDASARSALALVR